MHDMVFTAQTANRQPGSQDITSVTGKLEIAERGQPSTTYTLTIQKEPAVEMQLTEWCRTRGFPASEVCRVISAAIAPFIGADGKTPEVTSNGAGVDPTVDP